MTADELESLLDVIDALLDAPSNDTNDIITERLAPLRTMVREHYLAAIQAEIESRAC